MFLFVNTSYADEVIVDYSEESIPVLNEELRKLRSDIRSLNSDIADIDTSVAEGTVVQVANYQTGEYASGATAIFQDDSRPQITEGNEFMTLAFTPTSATNKLKIDVVWHGSGSAASNILVVALFKDATVDALACISETKTNANWAMNAVFTHYMTAGTTSEITFRVRAGLVAGTTYFNGKAAGREYGGSLASSITITEIKT